MNRTLAVFLATVFVVGAFADDYADDQRLLDEAAGKRKEAPQQPAPQPKAQIPAARAANPQKPVRIAPDTEVSQARVAAAIAEARLEVALAKEALRNSDSAVAAQHAENALKLIRQLPASDDTVDIELRAEGVRAIADRTGPAAPAGNVPPRRAAPPAGGRSYVTLTFGGGVGGETGTDMSVDAQVSPGSEQAPVPQAADGWPPGWPAPSDFSYQPEQRMLQTDDILPRELAQYRYQGIADGAARDDAVVRLTQASEGLQGGTGLVEYPDNWPEIVQKRAPYADGVIARTPSWRDKDGREWYMAIYDLHDLIYTPPDFGGNGEPAGSWEDLQFTLDRAALREYSWIFRGYYADFQDAWPLLQSWGGYDSFARMVGYSQSNAFGPFFGDSNGGKYSMEKQAEIVSMIRQFTGMREEQAIAQPAPADAHAPRVGPPPQVPQPLQPATAPR